MSFSFVGSTTATASSGSSVTITRSVTAGNLLVASILHQGGAISTVTDTASNTWATDSNGDTQTINSSTSQRRVQHYWCLSALTTASITVTIAGTAPFVVILSEYSHSGGAVTLRSVATAAGSTTTTPAATPSGTAVGDLLVGCMGYAQTTAGTRLDTLGSGYTELTGTNISTTRLSGAYRTLTAAGQAGPQWTMTSGTTGSSSVAFYEYVTPPVASFTKTATNLALSVDGTASTAGTGTISGYDWDWGDSTTHGTGSTASHTYASPGTYTVKLTVTNSAGGTASTTQSVTVSTSDIVLMSDTTATSGTASLTITKSTTAGRALVLAILHQGGSVTSVTDTAGNTWVTSANADTQASQESTSQRRVTHYWCVGAAAVTSVTIAAAGSVLLGELTEWSNVAAVRGAITSSSTTASPPAAAASPVVAGDVVVGCIGYLEATAGTRQDVLGSGWTELTGATISTTRMSAAYALRGSGGAAGPVWTFSTGTPSSGSSSIVLSKSTANNPPTVTTGGNMTGVEPGVTVTLTSTGADIDGDLVTLAWAQTSGTPTVALTDYGNGSASFRAPASVAGATLVFTVTATDGRGGTGTATSTVTVLTADRSGLIGGVRKPRLRTHT